MSYNPSPTFQDQTHHLAKAIGLRQDPKQSRLPFPPDDQ